MLWEVLELNLLALLENHINIDPQQFDFLVGRSTSDAIFMTPQLQEKYSSKWRNHYDIFVDNEKVIRKEPYFSKRKHYVSIISVDSTELLLLDGVP